MLVTRVARVCSGITHHACKQYSKVLHYQTPAMSADNSTPLVFNASRPGSSAMLAHREGLTLDNLMPAQAQCLIKTALWCFWESDKPHMLDTGTPPVLLQSLLNSFIRTTTSTCKCILYMHNLGPVDLFCSLLQLPLCGSAHLHARPTNSWLTVWLLPTSANIGTLQAF